MGFGQPAAALLLGWLSSTLGTAFQYDSKEAGRYMYHSIKAKVCTNQMQCKGCLLESFGFFFLSFFFVCLFFFLKDESVITEFQHLCLMRTLAIFYPFHHNKI